MTRMGGEIKTDASSYLMKQTTQHQNHSLIEIHGSNHLNQMIRFSTAIKRNEQKKKTKKNSTLIVANERLVLWAWD